MAQVASGAMHHFMAQRGSPSPAPHVNTHNAAPQSPMYHGGSRSLQLSQPPPIVGQQGFSNQFRGHGVSSMPQKRFSGGYSTPTGRGEHYGSMHHIRGTHNGASSQPPSPLVGSQPPHYQQSGYHQSQSQPGSNVGSVSAPVAPSPMSMHRIAVPVYDQARSPIPKENAYAQPSQGRPEYGRVLQEAGQVDRSYGDHKQHPREQQNHHDHPEDRSHEQRAPNNGNVRVTAELLGKIKYILQSRDQYISQLQGTLNQQQRERDEVETLWQQAQKEFCGTSSNSRSGPAKFVGIPSFYWVPSPDYSSEFEIEGQHGETVTKVRDFEDQGWVIPVSGSLRMQQGGLYRWSILVVKKCHHRPQMQFGIHGLNHEKPWRLVTTSRCSRSRDDDPWQDRPQGDKLIDEGDVIHVMVDLRNADCGSFSFSVNDEPFETVFNDLPLKNPHTGEIVQMIPVVSMGGDGSSVTLLKT